MRRLVILFAILITSETLADEKAREKVFDACCQYWGKCSAPSRGLVLTYLEDPRCTKFKPNRQRQQACEKEMKRLDSQRAKERSRIKKIENERKRKYCAAVKADYDAGNTPRDLSLGSYAIASKALDDTNDALDAIVGDVLKGFSADEAAEKAAMTARKRAREQEKAATKERLEREAAATKKKQEEKERAWCFAEKHHRFLCNCPKYFPGTPKAKVCI